MQLFVLCRLAGLSSFEGVCLVVVIPRCASQWAELQLRLEPCGDLRSRGFTFTSPHLKLTSPEEHQDEVTSDDGELQRWRRVSAGVFEKISTLSCL
jgi:hypothetical protein